MNQLLVGSGEPSEKSEAALSQIDADERTRICQFWAERPVIDREFLLARPTIRLKSKVVHSLTELPNLEEVLSAVDLENAKAIVAVLSASLRARSLRASS